ncbi:hypothetical protein [Nostoc sp.]
MELGVWSLEFGVWSLELELTFACYLESNCAFNAFVMRSLETS